MKRTKIKVFCLIIIIVFITTLNPAFGWYDETHLSVAKAAGYKKWYNATGADMAKIKAGSKERYNHWFNNPEEIEVTPDMVLEQVKRYDDSKDANGHLYGAIIASLREYRRIKKAGGYADYHLAFSAHYIGDLSNPLHNIPYDEFNKTHHETNDGIVEEEVLNNISKIKEHMYKINLRQERFEEDLAREIARIANISRQLGYQLKREKRDLTKQEAYIQLGHSASLFKAIVEMLEGKMQ